MHLTYHKEAHNRSQECAIENNVGVHQDAVIVACVGAGINGQGNGHNAEGESVR